MPNSFAYFALISWPVVTVLIFFMMPLARAILCSILAGYLLLPPVAALDVPGLPPLDKIMIANASAFLACLVMSGRPVPPMPRNWLAAALVLLFVLTPLASVLTNREPVLFRVGGLPGLGVGDAVHSVAAQIFAIMPFLLARQFLAVGGGLRDILLSLAIAGLLYSLPMLLEIRLSPQLNIWVYGFFQHQFDQMIRYGGFRPIVFLEHGLWVALLATMALLAAACLYASAEKRGSPWLWISGYLALVLLLCKSAAALLYAVVALPIALIPSVRLHLAAAATLACVAILYPLLRGSDVVPVQEILEYVAAFDRDRAQSLETRFVNEDQLLEHAREKPLFGWSLWGRNHIHDYATGEIVSITDGRWIIVLGSAGWFGYIAEFGLLALPILLLWRERLRHGAGTVSPAAGALALLLGVNLIDMLPNATLTPITWVCAGALLGYAERREWLRSPKAPELPPTDAGQACRPRRTIL